MNRLNDADRERRGWTRLAISLLQASEPMVIACSALKRIYRERIRASAGKPVTFLYLEGTREVLSERMKHRDGHFMPVALLDSQLATLEPPDADELTVKASIDQSPDAVVAELLLELQREAK